MADLDRWFNELTHKYLEVIRVAHLTCTEDSFTVRTMIALYREIRSEKACAASMQLFSEYITTTEEEYHLREK